MDAPVVTIAGDFVALGPMRADLVAAHRRWGNDFATYRMLDSVHGPATDERVASFLRGAVASGVHEFIISERATRRPIGHTALRDVDAQHGTAEFSIVIGEPDCRGRGYGTEATRLLLEYAFTTLGLRNVQLGVFAYNPTAIHVYEKVGFREIGRRRDCIVMGGRRWDLIWMSCQASEFLAWRRGA